MTFIPRTLGTKGQSIQSLKSVDKENTIRRNKNTSNMKKKAYMTPGFKEVSLEIEDLLGVTASAPGEGIQTGGEDDTDDDNRSRHYNVWDED